MPGLIGKKVGMTSIYGASGKNIPCTVIEVGPCVVTAPVDFTVLTIFSADLSTKLWSNDLSFMRIFCVMAFLDIILGLLQ